MRVQTKSVLLCLVSIGLLFGAASLILYPKLAGPLSEIGYAVHETRMDLLGAENFQHPPHRIKQTTSGKNPWAYLQYRVCDECPIPMYIGTSRNGYYGGPETQIRIMNIRPKYRYGMKLPAGDYQLEIQWDPSKPSTINKHTVTLTPNDNVFIFMPNGDRGSIRVTY